MLHEVLLALSGHPSPLFDQGSRASDWFPLITPAETDLLVSIGRLAKLHAALKSHLPRISSFHPSRICRSVSTAILTSHLPQFQNRILEVEAQILTEDPSIVGAYNIVPLASVIRCFDEWTRKIEWYWATACFILPEDASPSSDHDSQALSGACNGAAILNKLKQDSQTGYPDIETIATDLVKISEQAWLRQLSTWFLQGRSPDGGEWDLFIQVNENKPSWSPEYTINQNNLPDFVTPEIASSIIFTGKTLNYFQSTIDVQRMTSNTSAAPLSASLGSTGLLAQGLPTPDVLRHLVAVSSPVTSTTLSNAIAQIRSLLTRKLIGEVLDVPKIMQTLSSLRLFFLADSGDFTDALVQEADRHINSRHRRTQIWPRRDIAYDFTGVIMKDGEAAGVLTKTWAALAPLVGKGVISDDELEWARDHLTLTLSQSHALNQLSHMGENMPLMSSDCMLPATTVFEDLLLLTPAQLSLNLDPPFDLFLTSGDLHAYSQIHSYLLAIRRAHIHVTSLWKQSAIRRCHPAPSRTQSNSEQGIRVLHRRWGILKARTTSMRQTWATAGTAVLVLAELGEYLSGEVVQNSWKAFYNWVTPTKEGTHDSHSLIPPHLNKNDDAQNVTTIVDSVARESFSSTSGDNGQEYHSKDEKAPHDPEILAQAHRQYLGALTDALLLHQISFTKSLRTLLIHIDHLVAFVVRLQTVQRDLDMFDGGVSAQNYVREEKNIYEDMIATSHLVHNDIKQLIVNLKNINTIKRSPQQYHNQPLPRCTGFLPWVGGSVDRLLMRLEFHITGDNFEPGEA